MTYASSPPLPPSPAPDGSETVWVATRLAYVAGVLDEARATLREARSTTWRSGAATRFLELVGLLGSDLDRAADAVAEAERALSPLRHADGAAQAAVRAAYGAPR